MNHKTQQQYRKTVQTYFESHFSADNLNICYITQVHTDNMNDTNNIDSIKQLQQDELRQLYRWWTETKIKTIHSRANRCYMMVCIIKVYILYIVILYLYIYIMMNRISLCSELHTH